MAYINPTLLIVDIDMKIEENIERQGEKKINDEGSENMKMKCAKNCITEKKTENKYTTMECKTCMSCL